MVDKKRPQKKQAHSQAEATLVAAKKLAEMPLPDLKEHLGFSTCFQAGNKERNYAGRPGGCLSETASESNGSQWRPCVRQLQGEYFALSGFNSTVRQIWRIS